MKGSVVKVVLIAILITCRVTRNTLLAFVVLIFPFVVLGCLPGTLVYPLVVLVSSLVVLVCPFFYPLVYLSFHS